MSGTAYGLWESALGVDACCMGRRLWTLTPFKLLLLVVSLLAIFFLYLVFPPVTKPCNYNKDTGWNNKLFSANYHEAVQPTEDEQQFHLSVEKAREYEARGDNAQWGEHKLCVVVPFRDRFEDLLEFAPHMHKFLNAQRVRHKLVIVNQGDKLRFNRATLINIGFLQTKDDCDYMAMHDVDLLPLNPSLNYTYPAKGPMHLAAPDLHPRYHYKKFVGGILLLTQEHFEKCNGMSNRFWGWGHEDDKFYVRMMEANLTIHRPKNISTGYNTFKHKHDKIKRPRDFKRYGDQKKANQYHDNTGLSTVTYNNITRHESVIDGAPVTVLNVILNCDYEETPWCTHRQYIAKMENDKHAKKRETEAANAKIALARQQIAQAKRQMRDLERSEIEEGNVR